MDLRDGRGRLEHAHEVRERGLLVVDREQPQPVGPVHAARTPARNFGSVMTTVVPSPFSPSITSP